MTGRSGDWRHHFNTLSAPADEGNIARRRFLQGLLATGAVMATPGLGGIELASAQPVATDDRILVVVLMGGGNDGFSMVVPAEDGRYRDARRNLAIAPSQAIQFAPGLYWNNQLAGISDRYNAGNVAVIQGVGDPADDRSHFSSMARWMRGTSTNALGFTGWLGRWLDGAGLNGLGAISVGNSAVPLHMRGSNSKVTALPTSENLYGARQEDWIQPSYTALRALRSGTAANPWYSTVATSVADSIDTASFVAPIYSGVLPEDGLQRDLALAAATINLDIGARILTVAFGDFDTHDDHPARHQDLMIEFDAAVTEFFTRLDPRFANRVTMMTFSEFGRSWTANDSAGIDHGTTSTALVIGDPVRGGIYGQAPDYGTFDDEGDLESVVDFRSYYATILDGWLGADSTQILGGNYETMDIFSTASADSCQGAQPTITGSDQGETLRGTEGRDVILAGSGDDVIYGMGGDDLICAGEGADVIWGGAGNDEIVAGPGNDQVHGEVDDDIIIGGPGADTINGGGGNDVIDGETGWDRLTGSTGNDTITGGNGNDWVWAGPGTDTVDGGPGNDLLLGFDGNDTIRAGGGNDKMNGMNGNDDVEGGDGFDQIWGGLGDDHLKGQGGFDWIWGRWGEDRIEGGYGNDRLFGEGSADRIFGGPGNDFIDGGFGSDSCDGGAGSDTADNCETNTNTP